MRHGPAESHSSTGRDFDRRLTPEGRDRTLAVARELARRGDAPLRVISSPLVRARETALLVASTLVATLSPEIREELAPGGDTNRLIRELRDEPASPVLVIGHEPDVSTLTESLLGTSSLGFEAAMIVAMDVTLEDAKKRFVVLPSSLTSP
jgi:phosphohistidine phosphatase